MKLPSQIREAMVAHARSAHPQEACGLLAADRDGALRMAYCLTNIDASASSFTIDPSEHYHALAHAERNGWRLAGVYHSHPEGAAYPSATDVVSALDSEWAYVVVGQPKSDQPEVRSFRISEGRVRELV